MAVPKLGTTTTTEYSFTKAICQSTGGWLFCHSISLPLTSGLAVGRDGAGLSSHIVGAFELLGQAQYPQERREVLRGNLLKGYLQLIAKLVDQHFCIAALSYGLLKFFLHIIQRGLRVGGGLVFAVCFPDVPDDAVQIIVHDVAVKIAFLHLPQFQRPHIEVIFSGCILAHDGEVRTFIKEIRRYATIEELDEAVLNRLISRILIGEVKKVDGQKVQEVRIVYNFVGEIPEIAA